jgi:hypothetical protein
MDAFLQSVHTVARIEAPAAHRLDGVPGVACADAELGASVAQDVEARDSSRQYGRRPQWQVPHVGRQSHAVGPSGDEGQQGPGVQETWRVGMVRERDEVVARLLGEHRHGNHLVRGLRGGLDVDAELDLVPVIAHVSSRQAPGMVLAPSPEGTGHGNLREHVNR